MESQINTADTEYKKKDLKKRLAKLSGGVAVIKVGAATETEMKEKKMRIDDSLNATKAAIEEGVVCGGGLTLLHAASILERLSGRDNDESVGINIIKRSLEEPLRQIAKNAGREGAEVVARLKAERNEKVGYNAKTDKYEDMFAAGDLDPTKVVRNELQNSASISAMILTTEALVTDFDDEKDEKTPMIVM